MTYINMKPCRFHTMDYTLSSKVNLLHAINFRAFLLCKFGHVSSKFRGNEVTMLPEFWTILENPS